MDIPIGELIDGISVQLQKHTEELTDLDRAIGDGDHGINMGRGWNAVIAARADIDCLNHTSQVCQVSLFGSNNQ